MFLFYAHNIILVYVWTSQIIKTRIKYYILSRVGGDAQTDT